MGKITGCTSRAGKDQEPVCICLFVRYVEAVRMKIIIVEDEKSIRSGLARMLPKLDPEYEVAGAAKDGQEGYQLISGENPDLVIMDIEMPEMDGLTMLEKLRENGFQGKAIVLTAYSDFSYAKRAIELGIENYLLKPIKIEELKKTLQGVSASLKQAAGTRKIQEKLLSLEQLFRSALRDPCHLGREAIDELAFLFQKALRDQNGHRHVLVAGLFELAVHDLLDVLPDRVAVGTQDGEALYRGILHQLGLAADVGVPLSKIGLHVGDLLDHFFFRHDISPFITAGALLPPRI